MIDQVRKFIQQHHLLTTDKPVLVGLSGGAVGGVAAGVAAVAAAAGGEGQSHGQGQNCAHPSSSHDCLLLVRRIVFPAGWE